MVIGISWLQDIGLSPRSLQHYGNWLLGERVAARAVDLYLETFGSLDRLLDGLNLEVDAKDLVNGATRGMAPGHLARLSDRAVVHLALEDSRKAGRPQLRAVDWRVISYGLFAARTLREAVMRCVDCFEAIDWRCGRMTLRQRGDLAEIQLDAMRRESSLTGCFIDLGGIANIHGLLGWLIGQPLPITAIFLDHEESLFGKLALPDLPFPTMLDAGWTGFAIPSNYLDHPVIRSADEIATHPRGSFLFQGSDISAPESFSDKVRRLALKSLRDANRLPAFDEIVAILGGSPATLRRRLAEEGTSYREIRDSCRRELALDLLRTSTLSIEALAAQLDFCDSDAFRQAFHGWIGMPPTHYRNRARNEDTITELNV